MVRADSSLSRLFVAFVLERLLRANDARLWQTHRDRQIFGVSAVPLRLLHGYRQGLL